MYTTTIRNEIIYVLPKGANAQHTKDLIRALGEAGGKLDTVSGAFMFNYTESNMQILHKIGAIDKYLYIDKQYPDTKVRTERVPHLRSYQIPPLSFILSHGGRTLLADDVGLGKTLTSCGYFLYTKINYPLLIVCTASTKYQWESEFKRFDTSNKSVYVCDGVESLSKADADVIIVNYDLFSRHVTNIGSKARPKYELSPELKEFKQKDFQGAILDECQRLKSPTTLWNQGIRFIAKDVPNILALSATPIENKPIEFFNILNLLRPDIWHNYMHFALRYCDGHKEKRYIRRGNRARQQEYFDDTGASNLTELATLLKRHVMFRRNNHEAIPDLPKTTPIVLPLRLTATDKELYKQILEDAAELSTRSGGTVTTSNAMVKTNKLKEFSANAKIPHVISFLADFLQDTDEKIVVFTEHHDTIDRLYTHFKKHAVLFDGRCSAKVKEQAKQKFIDDPKTRIFFGQITAAGIGLDGLQKVASKLMYVELPYKPSAIQQCNGRLERIGSTSETVVAYFPILLDTIEEGIISILVNKQTNVLRVLGGDEDEGNISKEVQEYLKSKGLDKNA